MSFYVLILLGFQKTLLVAVVALVAAVDLEVLLAEAVVAEEEEYKNRRYVKYLLFSFFNSN
jgi:hypothetical protein